MWGRRMSPGPRAGRAGCNVQSGKGVAQTCATVPHSTIPAAAAPCLTFAAAAAPGGSAPLRLNPLSGFSSLQQGEGQSRGARCRVICISINGVAAC